MSDKNKKIVFNPIGWIIGGIFGILIIGYFYSFKPPLEVVSEYSEPQEVKAGESYQVCRKIKYFRDASITLDRVMTKNLETGDVLTINTPTIKITREKGFYSICRSVILPTYMESGKWVISTYISHSFWFWTHSFKAKDIEIVVVDNQRR